MKKEGKVFIAGLLVFLFIFSIAIFFAMAANDGAESTDIIATIRTEGCDADGICYVKTGDNTILFDVPSSVSEKQILFNLPALTITKKVKECGQGLCIGEARLSCQSGSQIAINIVDTPSFKSKDDLGNKIKNEPTKFRCDNDPPVFLMNGNDPQVSIQSGSGDPFFKSGDTIIIRANVTDEVSPINAKADFTELEGPEDLEGTCVFRVDHYECEITHVAPEGPLNDKSVIATFSDYAGNSISHTFEGIDVLKVENLEIDAWRLRNAMPQPSSLNLNLIKYYPKKVFVSFSLARKTGRYDIIKAETEGCHMVEQPGIGMNADEVVLDFKPKSRRGSFGISLSQRHFPTDVTPQFNCSLIITNKKGSTIIGTPEREYAVFTMNTYETELPTDVLNAERQKIYDDIEKDRVKIDQTMQTFKAAQAICGILAGGDGTSGIMQGMFWTPVVGEGLRRGGKRLGGAMDKIREVPLVKPLCDMVLCQSKYQTLVTDTLNSLPVASQMNDLATGISGSPASGVDPYDSILMAAITACGPAYYYNLQKINQLDCEYFRCVRDDTASGFPIEACGASRAYMTCKYTMGGWTKLIPGIGPLYNAVRDVFNVLRNPVGAITMGLSLLCRVRSHLPAPVDATCGVTEQIQKMNNDIETVRTMIQRFREMRENAPSDRCAEIMESGALPESDDPNPIDNPGIFTDHVVCGETGYCFIRHDDGRVFATDRDNNWYEVDETNDLYRLESTSDNHMQLYGQRTGAEEDADEPVAWLNPEDGNPMTDVESYKKEADKWKTEAERDEAEFANADAAWQRAREEAGTDYDADALDEARTLEENYLAFRASEDIFVDDLSYTPYTFEDWYENQGFDSEEEFNTAYEEAQLTIETQEPLEEVHNEREEAKKERDESKKAAEETAEDLEVMKYMNENTARIMAARRDYDSQALSDAFNGNVPQSFRNIQRELSQAEEAERNYRTAETNYNNCRERDEPEGCNAGELRTEMNTKKGKWNREKDDVEDAMDSEESRQFMEQHDVGWTSWTRGMQNARRIGTMTTWVYPSQDFGWYSAWFDDILGSDVMNYDQQIEDELCMADVEDVPSTGGVLFVESGGSVRAAAHIEGHRDGPNADNTYSYKITGAVVPAIPNPYGDGFNFQVIVRNPGQQLVNKTKIVESTPGGEQQDGYELFAKSREYTNKPILFQSTTKYTEVCIRFEGSWEDYFGTNNLDDFDSMLCNRIEFVE